MYAILFLFLFAGSYVFSTPQDTIPPTYTWISPEKYTILTTNTIRLCVDAHDNENGSGIKKVVFYASYSNIKGVQQPKHIIGEVDTFPYELIWDCSHIEDQDTDKLRFNCVVIDNAGNVSKKPFGEKNEEWWRFVLDRNPILNETQFLSHRTYKSIIIDGNLNEWAPQDSIVFSNNDNKIVVYSLWNNKNVFFGFKVEDRSFINHFGPERTTRHGMCVEDYIEIFLDTNHDHYEIISLPDTQFLLAPTGMAFECTYRFEDEYILEVDLRPDVEYKVTLQGTLNDDSDEDFCYTGEVAISWEKLGIDPQNGMSMGMEIWNNDKDYVDGNFFYSGWTTTASNLKNPSEWGNIVFTGEKGFVNHAILIACALLGGIAIFVTVLTVKKYRAKDDNFVSLEMESIIKAKDYIEQHYPEETLSREEIAHHVGLTPPYFGKLFKKETGYNIRDYVINIRIEKAKNLLLTTNKNISEISFGVGFNSLSHFGELFKRKLHKSPRMFRLSFEKHLKTPQNDKNLLLK